jgi:hypothetical protein
VVVIGAVEAVLAVAAAFTDLITPEQAIAIVAAIAPIQLVLRQLVWAPDSVEAVVVETAQVVTEQVLEAQQGA